MNDLINRIKSNKLITDSLWSLLGNVIGKGLLLFSGIFIARLLGKDVFGEYSIVRNTILIIGTLSTFGLSLTSTKFVSNFINNRENEINKVVKYITLISIFFSSIIALLIFLFSNHISLLVSHSKNLASSFQILSILIVFNALSSSQIGILSGLKKFKKLSKINSIIGILTFFLSIILTYIYELQGALIALLIAQIINCILNYIEVYKSLRNFPKISFSIFDKKLFLEILTFSFPLALQEFVFILSGWIAEILLVRNAGFGEFGLYNAALQWNSVIIFIPGILQNVFLSHLSNLDDKSNVKFTIIKKMVIVNFVATIIPCILVIIFSSLITKTYGSTYNGLNRLINISVLITVFTAMSNVYNQAFISEGKNWILFYNNIIKGVLTIIMFLYFFNILNLKASESMIYSVVIRAIVGWLYNIIVYKKIK